MVSIVLPYYNAEKYIAETISAVLAQTYTDWELLIVDDCSTSPDTEQVLKNVQSLDNRIKVLKTPQNCGAGGARNVAIREAKGKFLAFCDADDWWYPTKLEEQIAFMEQMRYTLTCTWYEDADKNLHSFYTMKQPPKQSFRDLMFGCNIGTPGVVINIEALGKKEMPNLRGAEDWGLWMKYLKDTNYIYTYPKPLWKYRHIDGSETANKLKLLKEVGNMYQEVLRMNCIEAWLICWFVFLPKNIYKKIKKIKSK